MNKVILITTYNRISNLKDCLESIKNSLKSNEYLKVIIYHSEIEETAKYVNELSDYYIKIPVNGLKKSAIENMNANRLFGWRYAFDLLQSDFVIALEDDVVIGVDALVFAEYVHYKFKADKRYRGVNLGAKGLFNEEHLGDYRRCRYGLAGQGSLISREIWRKMNKLGLFNKMRTVGLDSMIERYFKTGFVVVPRLSRYIDNGWGGTHAPKNKEDQYFADLKASWIGLNNLGNIRYVESNFNYIWRTDCIPYRRINNVIYDSKNLIDTFIRKFV